MGNVCGELAFAFACNPVFCPLPSLRVRGLHRRVLECIGGHADEGARDFAIESDFGSTDKIDDHASAVRAVFHFEFGADGYWSVAKSSGLYRQVTDLLVFQERHEI